MFALAPTTDASMIRALPTRLVVAELRALILEVRRRVAREDESTLFHTASRTTSEASTDRVTTRETSTDRYRPVTTREASTDRVTTREASNDRVTTREASTDRVTTRETSTDRTQLDESVLDTNRSSTWATVRQYFVRTVNAIDAAQPVRRVCEALRDLEASFLITSQRDAWLEGERSEWLELVRAMSRVDQSIDRFGLLRSIGYLLNDLAMSVKTEAYRSVFVRRDADGVCRKTTWHMRVEMILNLGVASRDTERAFDFEAEISARAVGFVRPSQVARVTLGASYDASTDALVRRQTARRRHVESMGTLRHVIDASFSRASDDDADDPYSNATCTQEELISLREEVSRLRLAREHEVLCTICYTNKRDTVVCPCLHLMYCHACTRPLLRVEPRGARTVERR